MTPGRGPELGAVIPAAGASRRMGQPKPLLLLDGIPLLARCAAVLRAAGAGRIVAVLREDAQPERELARELGLAVAGVPAGGDMFASVQAGLAALDPGLAAFVLPVDLPLARPGTLQALARVLAPDVPAPTPLAAIPVHRGRRGHPPLLSAEAVARVLAWTGESGLRAALAGLAEAPPGTGRAEGAAVVEVACDDPGVLLDLDTPEDVRRAEALLGLSPRAGTPGPGGPGPGRPGPAR